jgi:lipoprotein-anchoring transpeptidase ErfK/SrfK
MEYMVRFARGRSLAIGFHSIPVYASGRPMQSEAELGQYRSAGCVRQRHAQARQLYEWAPVGTPVVVLP